MRRRKTSHLDMLPLLDVFMVVLFVFASIQEDQLESSHAHRGALEQEVAELSRKLEALGERADIGEKRALAAAERATLRAESAEAEALRLAEALTSVRAKARESAGGAGADPSVDETLRRQEVLSRLLDHFSVFEIEIAGDVDPTGVVSNRCCYRTELAGTWTACGVVPPRSAELSAWLDDGASGLVDALRKTKGGNAVTIVRQDEEATYRVAGALGGALRERFAEHKLYNEGVAVVTGLCE